jgi:heterodisulfide reductase subunit A-like polyferredoxin
MSVDEDKCIGCKKCVNVCLFEAPSIQSNGKATINNAICERCGVCPSLCPTKAISLTYADGSKFDFDKF